MLNTEERIRYDRQLIIPEIGEAGQEKLKQASVFIAGVGGLGSISAYYMAAAGIGYLRIADKDIVELGNLNRQIIHHTGDINKPKTESAAEKLRKLNPFCQIDPIYQELREDNSIDLIKGCSIILDATDNIQTRKILNRASIELDIPFIYGGINGFSGMVTTFIPKQTACFECLFPDNFECREKIGALGPVAGFIACLQCIEAIKIILNLDQVLKNRLLIINGIDISFMEMKIEKNPDCKVCGMQKMNHV